MDKIDITTSISLLEKENSHILTSQQFASVVRDKSAMLVKPKHLKKISYLFDLINKNKILIFNADSKTQQQLDLVIEYCKKKEKELYKNSSTPYSTDKKRIIKEKLYSFFILLTKDSLLKDNPLLPEICGFIGCLDKQNTISAIPYLFYQEILYRQKYLFANNIIKEKIFCAPNILEPKSKQTAFLFLNNIKIKESNFNNLQILDMGTGSGILTYALMQKLKNCHITVTDILPESLASVKYNLEKIFNAQKIIEQNQLKWIYNENTITVSKAGSLFDNIMKKFDMIVFNAPWINAEFRNREEMALNDKDLKVTGEFLEQAKRFLNPEGRIFLLFSDNSGPNFVKQLETKIESLNYTICDIHQDKIQSYQKNRKYMKILLYILEVGG